MQGDTPLGRICNPTALSISICNATRYIPQREAAAEQVVGGVKLLAKKFFHRLYSLTLV